jgi:hypothetical protein
MGALALLAGLDVRTGKVLASTPPTTGIAPFMALMDQIMSQEPHRGASRVFVIVDNGSDHRGKAAAKRLRDRHPNCVMIHTPVRASWLNGLATFVAAQQAGCFHATRRAAPTGRYRRWPAPPRSGRLCICGPPPSRRAGGLSSMSGILADSSYRLLPA